MKNRRIINAYDSINPSVSDKQRMLDHILAEAKLEDTPNKTRRTREPVVYTRKQSAKTSRTNIVSTIAAAVALLVVTGFGAAFLMNREDMDPVYVEPTKEVVAEKTAADHYAPVLEKYHRAISEGWTKEQCEIEGISLRLQVGYDVTKAGYALLDLDSDGREELIIAEESTDRTDNIWDLYTTLEDGTPVQLWVDEQDGGQCRLYEGNVISISYSNKHELDLTFYCLEAGKLVVRESLQWEDEDTVFHTDAHGNTRQVTSKEGQSISNGYDIQKLNLTWLADISLKTQSMTGYKEYDYILNKYVAALTEHWSKNQCFENDISAMAASNPEDHHNLGWSLMDIDNNGTEELIISYGDTLVDLYCIKPDDVNPKEMIIDHGDMKSPLPVENGVCHLAKSEGSIQYTLCEDSTLTYQIIYEIGTSWCYYKVQPWGLELQSVLMYRSQKDGNMAYSYGSNEDNQIQISKEEAGNIIVAHQSMKFQGTPIVEPKSYAGDISEHYKPLIELYHNAIQENWNPGQCMENDMSLMIGYYGELYETLGHNQIDLNGDGNDELIITDGTNIYDLYTVSNGVVIHLASGMERKEYFLTTDGYIYEMGSGSYAVGYYALYILGQQDLVLERGFMMDAEADPGNPWFYYDGVDKGDPCPTSEAAAVMDAIHFAEISFIPFG